MMLWMASSHFRVSNLTMRVPVMLEEKKDDQGSLSDGRKAGPNYVLDDQIGYKLRLANQRHLEIFSRHLPEMTPTQFSILVRLREVGEVSQNHLGRLIALDAATTKTVIDRLSKKQLVSTLPNRLDRRRVQISLTEAGAALVDHAIADAKRITKETTKNLTQIEKKTLMTLLDKLA